MKKLLFQIIGGWHHGRGGKYTRKENFELALKHYKAALDYALRADNQSSIPIEMECISRTFVRLNNYEEAHKYAIESLESFKKLQWAGSIFKASVGRVSALIETIERRESI